MLKFKFIIINIVLFNSLNINLLAQSKINWNGYLQFRFSDNYYNQAAFSVRRAKLWLNGSLPGVSDNWNYKLQANFFQQSKYQFLLQDVYVNYSTGFLELTAGQFVTDFSMQRKQSDYLIPIVERAGAIKSLVPCAETMARDIGVELKITNSNTGSISFGFFNGNGANNVSSRRNFLYVNSGRFFLLNNSEQRFELGYSLSYRYAHNLQLNKIYGDDFSFTGNDFRFDLNEKLNLGKFEFQSEYLESHLGNQKVNGYYILTDYLFASKNLIVLSVEQLNDLNPSTNDRPWYVIGYSYLLKGNDIKFSIDNRFQLTTNKTNAFTTLQVQYFFNEN